MIPQGIPACLNWPLINLFFRAFEFTSINFQYDIVLRMHSFAIYIVLLYCETEKLVKEHDVCCLESMLFQALRGIMHGFEIISWAIKPF